MFQVYTILIQMGNSKYFGKGRERMSRKYQTLDTITKRYENNNKI